MKKWLFAIPFVVVLAGVWIAQSDWLREEVRLRLIAEAERATGGRVEIGAFHFAWRTFTAEFDRVTIHGLEPADQAPLLTVEKAIVGLRRDLTIRSVVAEKPAAHLILNADGTSNIPPRKTSDLDVKIGAFDIRNGTFQVNERITPWNAKGHDLTVSGTFDAFTASVNVDVQGIPAKIAANASWKRNRLTFSTAHVEAEGAVIDLTEGAIDNGVTAKYKARHAMGTAEGTLRFASMTDYLVTGTARGEFRGVKGSGSFDATPGLVKVHDGKANVMGGQAEASAEVRDFKTFTASGRVRDVVLRYGATASGTFEAAGNLKAITSGRFQGLVGGTGRGEVDVRYTPAKIEFGRSWMEVPHTRAELTGTLGERLNVKLQSTDLTDVAKLLQIELPVMFGQIAFEGTVTGPLKSPRIDGRLTAKDVQYRGELVSAITGDVNATPTEASIANGDIVYKEIRAKGRGSVSLKDWLPAEESVIAATGEARQDNIVVNGTLAGTVGNPTGAGDVTVSRGAIYGQPYDSLTGKVQVLSKTNATGTGVLVSGPKRVNITGRYEDGLVNFSLTSNTMPLNEIALIRERQPDVQGFGKFHADGTVRLADRALLSINADASANGLELGGRNLGDTRLTATSNAGIAAVHIESNAGQAGIKGDGTVRLTGDYPLNGTITFANAGLASHDLNVDGTAQGKMTIAGALRYPEKLTAMLDVEKLEVHALNLPSFSIVNNGPLRASITEKTLRVESARLRAPETDVTVSGSVIPLNLQMKGSVNLAVARTFNPDLAAQGTITLDAGVKGDWNTPDLSGRATLAGGTFRYADLGNGLTNATGIVTFSGSRATIQSFTAESGGGRVEATGFAALTNGEPAFRIETNAVGVRVRYPEGVSTVSDARLTLAGTSRRSQASGTITIHRVNINPKSDLATILASAAQPVNTAAVRTGLIENVNLDVQVETAPDATVETSVTQTIQADANLRLRGTLTNPAVLGRINVTQGELIFFGNKYSINQGAISFYNPVKIDPILNVDLQTRARGVDVILTVSGPIGNLNMSYRSDPPLQFSDVVALLATGRAPTDANRAVAGSQGFQQLGTSAFLGQAIANPVAGRLQRFFGVSRLKIDPRLSGVTGSPQARLTVEQQVTPDILFTYITDVSSTSTQLIRVEWAYDRHWSAILTREENGYVGLDFAYKKRFK